MLILKIVICVLVVLALIVLIKLSLVIKGAKGNTKEVPDYLMILGYRVKDNIIDETLRSRIDGAAEYLKKNPSVTAVPCGGFTQKGQEKSEAEIMAAELIKCGISSDRIILEDKSKTTKENFINAKNIIDSLGDGNTKKTAFLSSELHLYRAGLLAKDLGFKVTSVPAESPSNVKIKNYLREAFILMYMDIEKLGGRKNG